MDTAVSRPLALLLLVGLMALAALGWLLAFTGPASAQTNFVFLVPGPLSVTEGQRIIVTASVVGSNAPVEIQVLVSVSVRGDFGVNSSAQRAIFIPRGQGSGSITLQTNDDNVREADGSVTIRLLDCSGCAGGYTALNRGETYTVTVRDNEPVPPTPTPTPTPRPLDQLPIRLVSTISYTLDAGEVNRLELQVPPGESFPMPRAVRFRCATSDGISIRVTDNDFRRRPNGLAAWKVPAEGETKLQATVLAVQSEYIRSMTCMAFLWNTASTGPTGQALKPSNVELKWQQKGRTLFRKEQAFGETPGGSATWLFIPPVFMGLVFAGVTRNAAGTLLVVATTLGIAVWFTESPPILWLVVVGTAAAGVLLFIQFGFRGR